MFLFFLFVCFALISGGMITLIGLFSKRYKILIKAGLIIFFIPVVVIVLGLFFETVFDIFKVNPSQKELVGEYEIVEVTNLKFDKNSYKKYKLIFKDDSTFTLTPTPYIEICENGKYTLDYSYEDNELSYRCGNGFIMGGIDRGFSNYRIKFSIGDPDSDQVIYFAKTSN